MLRPAADHRVHQDYISDHLELTGERKEEKKNADNIGANTTYKKIKVLAAIVISDKAMPIALVTVIMVVVVTILLLSPSKAAS